MGKREATKKNISVQDELGISEDEFEDLQSLFQVSFFNFEFLDTVDILRKKGNFEFECLMFQLAFGHLILFLARLEC